MPWTRRTFVGSGLAAGAGSLLSGCAPEPGKQAGGGRPLRILFYTDVHTLEDGYVADGLRHAAEAMRAEAADLVLCGGDCIHAGYLSSVEACMPRFERYREFLGWLDRPVEHLIGNHDLAGAAPQDGGPPAADPRALAKRMLGIGNTYRSFDLRGHHFILLDSVQLVGGARIYRGWVDGEQMEWLRRDLGSVAPETPIVLATHIPFRTTFLQAVSHPTAPLPGNLVVENANEVLALFQGRRLPLVLQGHLHSNEVVNWCGRDFLMGGALCAAWWSGPLGETGFGYGIVELGEEGTKWTYCRYEWPTAEGRA